MSAVVSEPATLLDALREISRLSAELQNERRHAAFVAALLTEANGLILDLRLQLAAANAHADRAFARLDRTPDDAERQALGLGPRPEEGGAS